MPLPGVPPAGLQPVGHPGGVPVWQVAPPVPVPEPLVFCVQPVHAFVGLRFPDEMSEQEPPPQEPLKQVMR